MSRFKQFIHDDRGSATIEFVIWIPWFMFLLMITTDISFVYYSLTTMANTSRDAARRLSTGEIEPANLTGFVNGKLGGGGYTIDNCSTADEACVRITRPFSKTAVFGRFLGDLIDKDLSAQTAMRKEPGVT